MMSMNEHFEKKGLTEQNINLCPSTYQPLATFSYHYAIPVDK